MPFVYEDDEAACWDVSASRFVFALIKLPFSPACHVSDVPSPFRRRRLQALDSLGGACLPFLPSSFTSALEARLSCRLFSCGAI